MRRVEIEWNDACGRNTTHSLDDAKGAQLLKMSTIGYLIHKDKQKVTIVQTVDEYDQVDNRLTIPRSQIRKISVI